jgi:phage repressor protein C with HTH and peptisase S24 domain
MIYVACSESVAGMETMGDRLRAARLLARFSSAAKAAEALGVSASTYRAHENGQNEFGPEEAEHYARKFGTTAAHLLTGNGKPTGLTTYDPDRIDRLGAEERNDKHQGVEQDSADRIDEIDVTAGLGGGGLTIIEQNGEFSGEVVRDFWRLPPWVLNRFNAQAGNIKAFPSQGDSMEPTIEDGDVVFADIRHRVPSPPGIYVLADEFGGVVVKRLEVTSRPRDEIVTVRVISDNPRHAAKELTLDEITILGRYVGRFTA